MVSIVISCMSMAPAVRREVSVMTVKGWEMSGIRRTGAEENICLSILKVFCCSLVQIQGLFFQVRRLRGATILEKFGMNFR